MTAPESASAKVWVGEIGVEILSRSYVHSAVPRASRPSLAVALLFLWVAAAPAFAKAPSKKDVDEAMLRLADTDLGLVAQAEEKLADAGEQLVETERSMDIARKDERGAKAWVDAANSVLRAISLDRKAAEEGARGSDLERLATQQVRSEASLKWRKARASAARSRINHLQVEIGWLKTERTRLEATLKEAKLLTYKASVADTPDVDGAIAKAAASRSTAEGNSAKARERADKAEAAWQSAVATAKALAP